MSFVVGAAHALAQIAATLAFVDGGGGNSTISIYGTAQPLVGEAAGAEPLAVLELATPCGTLSGGGLTLHPVDGLGALAVESGIGRWARWARFDGVLVADGSVSDAANGGDFIITGATTPPGETSPRLVAGGVVLLGAVTLT